MTCYGVEGIDLAVGGGGGGVLIDVSVTFS
jgi:hypothetical protein